MGSWAYWEQWGWRRHGEGWGWASSRTKARTESSNKEIHILRVSFICFVFESMKPFVAPGGLLLGWIFPNSRSRFPPSILFNLFIVHTLCFFILFHFRSEECPPWGIQCLNPPIIPILFSFGFFYLMEQKILLSSLAYSIMRKRRYLVWEGDSVEEFVFLCKCFHRSSTGRDSTKLVLCFALFLLWLPHCLLAQFLLEEYGKGPISGMAGPLAGNVQRILITIFYLTWYFLSRIHLTHTYHLVLHEMIV